MAQKRARGSVLTALILTAVFLAMLLLYFWTPYAGDDFSYLLHFGTKERIQSLQDVAESMYIHSLHMNGRVVSHTLAQLFSMAPKGLFNLCSAAVYTALMYLMYRAAAFDGKRSPWLLGMICMGFFSAMPVFGQVCLWYVGAFNYLWALLWGLIFMLPYLLRYLERPEHLAGWRFPLFCVGSLLFGMYSEITSFVFIYLGAALLILGKLVKGHSLKTRLWLPWVLACCGYLVMLSIPAELGAKQAGGMDLALLLNNITRATQTLTEHCGVLLGVYLVLFVLGLVRKVGRDRLILAALLLTGAVGGNYMTIVASYYPTRCLATTVMLLILGIGLLLAPWRRPAFQRSAAAVLVLVFAVQAWFGVTDIYRCYGDFLEREAVIIEAAEAGESLVHAPIVVSESPYCVFWPHRDLSTTDPATWPNFAMGKVYGIEILGVLPE